MLVLYKIDLYDDKQLQNLSRTFSSSAKTLQTSGRYFQLMLSINKFYSSKYLLKYVFSWDFKKRVILHCDIYLIQLLRFKIIVYFQIQNQTIRNKWTFLNTNILDQDYKIYFKTQKKHKLNQNRIRKIKTVDKFPAW